MEIKWQAAPGAWVTFDMADINHMPRNHGISLFSNETPVIIKEDDNYIVNTPDLLAQYQRAGRSVKLLSECTPSTESIERVGFWGGTE